ncbi:hypothetical protein FZEAL_5710 [Fusarium zealandicum]|uniref:rRNA biogenesis protein RRP36 n=1 Tax=Fusarium zealandicum TaxID=1053134 RepID=A0A8H4UJB5_9HYPO|nr:hypothetical protein FZEAL_5710 [Fusarium zealandicum]
MSSKRKSTTLGLDRRVRPRREDDWEEAPASRGSSSDEDDDDDEVEEQGIRGDHSDDESEDQEGSEPEDGHEEGSEPEQEPAAPKVDFSSISFGALAKAQESLPSSGRKSKSKQAADADSSRTETLAPRKPTKSKNDPTPKRSSKHAPQEQTSKRPVTRRREILPDTRRQYRDPRFDPAVTGRIDEEKAGRAYAFLDEYRDTEMADLRAQIRKTKDEYVKDDLKRQLQSMESRKKTRKRREEADSLLKEHRKKEKELVAQGKTPYYLKKSEQKKQVLVNRYEGMSKGQIDHAIERKRKKVAGKEKKEMDFLHGSRSRD